MHSRGAKIFFMLHPVPFSWRWRGRDRGGRGRGGGGGGGGGRRGGRGRETGSAAMCCQVQGHARGLLLFPRWRCAIQKILREVSGPGGAARTGPGAARGRARGGGTGRGNEFSVQHTTRRCTRVSNVATRSSLTWHYTRISELTATGNLNPYADMDWMEMDDVVRTF